MPRARPRTMPSAMSRPATAGASASAAVATPMAAMTVTVRIRHRGRGREAGVPEAAEDLAHSAEAERDRGQVPAHALLDEHRHQVDEHSERRQRRSVRWRQPAARTA